MSGSDTPDRLRQLVPAFKCRDRTYLTEVVRRSKHMRIVQTAATKAEMDRHWGAVLAYVEQLKTELGLDVMALEVNQQVNLV